MKQFLGSFPLSNKCMLTFVQRYYLNMHAESLVHMYICLSTCTNTCVNEFIFKQILLLHVLSIIQFFSLLSLNDWKMLCYMFLNLSISLNILYLVIKESVVVLTWSETESEVSLV